MERGSDREVAVEFPAITLTQEERVQAKQNYFKAERAEKIPIGETIRYSSYIMNPGETTSIMIAKTFCFFAMNLVPISKLDIENKPFIDSKINGST